jgi:hypothetical protein
MLTSNVGISVATHFCGGEYVATNIAVGEAKADCGMAMSSSECHDKFKDKQLTFRSLCCVNHVTNMTLGTDFEQIETVGQVSENLLILGWFTNITSTPCNLNFEFTHFDHLYSPPQTVQDIPVLIQSFLI